MYEVVELISFIIWIIYFWILVSREIRRKNMNKDKYTLNYLKKNIFYLIRLDNLFFLIMFYIYKGFNNRSVTIYLYFVFAFASLVFILYDIQDKYDIKKNKIKKEKIYLLGSLILFLMPVIHYRLHKDISLACYYTLIINFLVPIVIFLINIVVKKIKKK